MQLKRYPADFRVRELVDLPEGGRGEYVVHELRKEKLDTLDAISKVAREAGVDRADIAFAGLKDRQGITEQFITIKGKTVDIRDRWLQVRKVGYADRPITSKVSRGNAFEIVVRDLGRGEVERLERRLGEIDESGFCNYFDDQRFNCIRHGQGFVMKAVLAGEFDRALSQLIASPSRVAKAGDVKLKELLSEHWGDWDRCSRLARGPIYERLFAHLIRNPEDYRGALEQMPTRNKLIHAFAYQSHLWNRAVSRHLTDLLDPRRRTAIETEAGRNVSWWTLPPSLRDRLRGESTPLYGPEGEGGSSIFQRSVSRTLDEAQLTPDSFRVHKVQGMVLKEEPRDLLVMPRELDRPRIEPDDANRGRKKATVRFELPRGSYATMLLKHVWAYPWKNRTERTDGRGQPTYRNVDQRSVDYRNAERDRGGRSRDRDDDPRASYERRRPDRQPDRLPERRPDRQRPDRQRPRGK